MSSFDLAGGPTYHARAIFNRSQWQPLRSWVSDHLKNSLFQSEHLVLIGPSGGWSLPKFGFFERFKTISVYDPDPWAKKIFELRFRIKTDWHLEDFFAPDGSHLHTYSKEKTYLFCNVLGQLGLVYQKDWPKHEIQFTDHLLRFFKTHEWFSYHDVYSLRGKAKQTQYHSLDDYVEKENPQSEVVDHLTNRYFLKQDDALFAWKISRNRVHLLGWQSSESMHFL